MNEYKISVYMRPEYSPTPHSIECKNHIVWAFTRKSACEIIMEHLCEYGVDIVAVVFDPTNLDNY
jgi:basic membrane lipoprotein Med (substrate-binding protein (PBP1-ABC) superfamily)